MQQMQSGRKSPGNSAPLRLSEMPYETIQFKQIKSTAQAKQNTVMHVKSNTDLRGQRKSIPEPGSPKNYLTSSPTLKSENCRKKLAYTRKHAADGESSAQPSCVTKQNSFRGLIPKCESSSTEKSNVDKTTNLSLLALKLQNTTLGLRTSSQQQTQHDSAKLREAGSQQRTASRQEQQADTNTAMRVAYKYKSSKQLDDVLAGSTCVNSGSITAKSTQINFQVPVPNITHSKTQSNAVKVTSRQRSHSKGLSDFNFVPPEDLSHSKSTRTNGRLAPNTAANSSNVAQKGSKMTQANKRLKNEIKDEKKIIGRSQYYEVVYKTNSSGQNGKIRDQSLSHLDSFTLDKSTTQQSTKARDSKSPISRLISKIGKNTGLFSSSIDFSSKPPQSSTYRQNSMQTLVEPKSIDLQHSRSTEQPQDYVEIRPCDGLKSAATKAPTGLAKLLQSKSPVVEKTRATKTQISGIVSTKPGNSMMKSFHTIKNANRVTRQHLQGFAGDIPSTSIDLKAFINPKETTLQQKHELLNALSSINGIDLTKQSAWMEESHADDLRLSHLKVNLHARELTLDQASREEGWFDGTEDNNTIDIPDDQDQEHFHNYEEKKNLFLFKKQQPDQSNIQLVLHFDDLELTQAGSQGNSKPAKKPTQVSIRHSISPLKSGKPEMKDSIVYIQKHQTPQKFVRTSLNPKPFAKFDLQQVQCTRDSLPPSEDDYAIFNAQQAAMLSNYDFKASFERNNRQSHDAKEQDTSDANISTNNFEYGGVEGIGSTVRYTAEKVTIQNLEQQSQFRYKHQFGSFPIMHSFTPGQAGQISHLEVANYVTSKKDQQQNRFNKISTHRGDNDNEPLTPRSTGSVQDSSGRVGTKRKTKRLQANSSQL